MSTPLQKRNRALGLLLLLLIALVFGITIVKIRQAGSQPHAADSGAVEMGTVHGDGQ